MSKNVKTQLKEVVGRSVNAYNQKVKPKIDDIKFKEQYQGRIIDCMVGEIDDNYIETPETDSPIVKLEYSKEGVVKIPSIKGKTILVDADGNETDTPGEGCKLVSVGDDGKLVVSSNNRNLVESQKFPFGINSNGQENPNGGNNCTNFCKVEPNVNYVTSQNGIKRATNVFFYDKDKIYISKSNDTKPPTNFTTPNNCWFTRHTFGVQKESELQLEYGDTPKEYVVNETSMVEILLDEPLRSLPNGVCDERIDDKIIRRVGKIIFNGSVDEKWGKGGWSNDDRIELYRKDESFNSKRENGICNVINVIPNSITNDTIEGVIVKSNAFSIFIPTSKLISPDLNSALLHLSKTPLEVLYELAEPIIEELPNAIALQGFDDATIYVESNLIPTVKYGYNAEIPFKQEIQTQKEEVDTNIVDIEDNIIPYLMDVEFNLMMMEDM